MFPAPTPRAGRSVRLPRRRVGRLDRAGRARAGRAEPTGPGRETLRYRGTSPDVSPAFVVRAPRRRDGGSHEPKKNAEGVARTGRKRLAEVRPAVASGSASAAPPPGSARGARRSSCNSAARPASAGGWYPQPRAEKRLVGRPSDGKVGAGGQGDLRRSFGGDEMADMTSARPETGVPPRDAPSRANAPTAGIGPPPFRCMSRSASRSRHRPQEVLRVIRAAGRSRRPRSVAVGAGPRGGRGGRPAARST